MIHRYLTDFISLFFPKACAGCDTPLVSGEKLLCTTCWYRLPGILPNEQIGTLSTGQSASFLYLLGSSRVQRIIHQLKYRNRPEIGTLFGEKYGPMLQRLTPFNRADIIVPVPLHLRKLRKRGYNQSAFFAQGLAHALKIPVVETCLIRHRVTDSQTTKNRYERYQNMEAAFELTDVVSIVGKHVLLVDDVLTTGATLEACSNVLLSGGAAQVNAVTIAKAR